MAIIRAGGRTARRREWAAQRRIRAQIERLLAREIAAELARIGDDAVEALESGAGPAVIDMAIRGHDARIGSILDAGYRRTMFTFGNRFFEDGRSAFPALETRDAESEFARRVQHWIETFGAQKVEAIAATTRRRIVEAIGRGADAGEGIAAIAKRIHEGTRGMVGLRRAVGIARTEVHAASNAATDEALIALDVPRVRREWVAAEDDRTRKTHRRADGQVRDQREPFQVGAVSLKHPGDPSGPPEEVINCRCVTAAVIEDEG